MQLIDIDEKSRIRSGFHALSDNIRLDIINLLCQQELCVCELCEKLNISQSKLSFHLKTLKEAELIRSRQQGRWIYYRINLPQLVVLEQYLSDFRRYVNLIPARICKD